MFKRDECIKYAQEFVDSVVAKGIELKYAKLFGSYAKGAQDVDSDVDILLVADDFIGVGFIDNGLIADELIKFDEVQVKTYPIKDYEEGDPLVDEIDRTAIQLTINQ
jgi:predicted nucleotidyltransferase